MNEETTNNLVNVNVPSLDKMSQPVTKLVEACSKVLGDFMDPALIVARAKARAEARTITTKGKIKDKELWDRAQERVRAKEERRQLNIEATIHDSLSHLPETVEDRPVSEDWLVQFFECVQDIGDDEMRSVWSKLLAGEVAAPGKYSMLTMSRLKTMRPQDAVTFERLKTYLWTFNDGDEEDQILITRRPTFYGDPCDPIDYMRIEPLLDLELHSLIRYHDIFSISVDRIRCLRYFGEMIRFDPIDFHGNMELDVNPNYVSISCTLTQVGIELLGITPSKPDDEYKKTIVDAIAVLRSRAIKKM